MDRETKRALTSLTPRTLEGEQLVIAMAKYFSRLTSGHSKGESLSKVIQELEEKAGPHAVLITDQHTKRVQNR